MQKNLKKVLSFVLALVMVLGLIPMTVLADEAQVASSDLPTAMDGLTIAYPYNTENVQRTGTVPNRFGALTFESARNEVESAQMILTPNFKVDSFELTMSSMTNAKGNVIPSWAFEVYVQQYATVTGSGNSPKFGDFKTQDSWFLSTKYLEDVFHPRSGNKAWDGTYPDALIPQDAAIANGLNTISANQNQGIWVNLNVQNAAPGTYNGTATLTINGNAMQIPVSVRIYDVAIPDEVHMTTAFGIWWDMMYAGEGINANDSNVRENMITNYYNYVVSKRITPWDRGVNQWRYTDMLVEYAVANATDPSISSYRLHFTNDTSNDRRVDRASVVTCLTALIHKNIELVNAGNNVDLFEKAYYYFSNVDEPAGGSNAAAYADVQACIDTLDSVKAELAPMLASYPDLQASFLALKNVVTGPDPVNYKNTWYIDGCPDYSKQSSLTSTYDSVVYCPQFNYLQTADMRNTYADDSEIWWYGCCHPVAPYPTYHLNTPLANTRAVGFMMYDYEIDGMLSSSVNLWGTYNDDGSINLPSNYTTISGNGTPGDMILLYPGADYGVEGPVGTLRIETIRESSEDYEYLWMLENTYGISDISAYTAGLYEGAVVTGVYDGNTVDPDGDGNTDASDLYHTRRVALLTKLEQLNVSANGATNIAPGNEGFVRGDRFTAGKDTYFDLEDAAWKTLSFDYKPDGAGELAVIIRGSQWTKYYGDYRLNQDGEKVDYPGVTTEKLDDGYIRATFNIDALTRTGCAENMNYQPSDVGLLDIFQWSTTGGYIDNIQLSMEAPEEEPKPVVRGKAFTAGKDTYFYLDEPGAWDYVSFEYKIEGTGELAAILRGTTWTTYYGDFRLTATGEKQDYAGITTEVLEDGYVRVTFDIAQLNRSGCVDNRNNAPVDIKLIDIFGAWTTAEGYIDNIQVWNKEIVIRGEPFTAGKDTFFYLDQAGDYETLSFDYWVEAAGEVAVIMRGSQWSKFYGDFRLTENGEKVDYAGITTEVLEDGYIHVTFDIPALQRSGCANNRDGAPVDIKLIDIYNWTTVNGYIDNIQYETHVHSYESVVTEATPYAQGYTTHTCSCGDSYVDSYTDYEVPGYLVLTDNASVNWTLNQDLYIDLNGYNLSGTINTNGYVIYGMDATTNAYSADNMGIFSCVDAEGKAIVPQSFYNTEDAKYMTIAGESGYSFHRYYVGITSVSLAPSVTGFGYKAAFFGDALVQAQVKSVGYDLWITEDIVVNRSVNFQNSVTLRLKNFDAVNYGNTPVNAKATMTLVDGTVLESGVQSWSLQQMVETINADYTAYSAAQVAAVKAMIKANPVMENWQVENLMKEVIRGKAFTAGKDTYFTVEAGNWDTVSFEYKTEGAGEVVAILRGSAWGVKYYGDYRFTESGEKVDYAGVSTEMLHDGYIRVTFDVSALGRTGCVDNLDSVPADIALIDIFNWTTVNGYIDNIQVSKEEKEEVIRGTEFTGGVDKFMYLDKNATEIVTFDYKLTTAGDIHVILRAPDWNGFYGDFEFNAAGEAIDYAGISCEQLDDGYIRVTMTLAELNRTGCVNNRDSAPASVGIFDLYQWGTASGYVDNIQLDP